MMANKPSNWGTCPAIYFAKVPDFQELCTVSLQVCIDSPGINNISQFGSQPQIIKCRELIFTEPCVLASPSLQEQGLIFVIIQQNFWKTGKLQMRCQKSGLKIGKPTRVIPAVFQACLSYTLRAKLAPLWNKAGDLYIQGRDFLTCSTKANAMSVEINVTDAEICIALKPTLIKLSQSDLKDFEIAPGVLEHFFASNTHSIPEYAIDDKWCHILPSLKKGKVVSITHQIPPISPFKAYKDIRRYWKNAYGYRLPESDVGIIYYNVYFPAIGNTLFTYPDFCVFKREPVLLPRVDPMTIIPSFLHDVETKLPSICGYPFKVNPKAQYATTGLYQASIQNNSLSRLTLATIPPAYARLHIPLRQLPVLSPNQARPAMLYNSPHAPAIQQRPTLPNRALAKAFDAAFQQAGGMCLSPRPMSHTGTVHSQRNHTGYQNSQHVGQQPNTAIHQQPKQSNRPIFPTSPLGHLASMHSQSQPTLQGTPQHVGQQPNALSQQQFRESRRPIMPPSPCATTHHTVIHHSPLMTNSLDSARHTAQVYKGIPSPRSFTQSASPILYSSHQKELPLTYSHATSTNLHASHHVPLAQPLMLTPVTQAQQTQAVAKIVPSFRPHKARNLSTQPQDKTLSSQSGKVVPIIKPTVPRTNTPTFSAKVQLNFDKEPTEDQQAGSQYVASATQVPPKPSQLIKPTFGEKALPTSGHGKDYERSNNLTKAVKRKAKTNDSEPTVKKPRAKPKVQEGVDMQALLVSDQLSKVNTVTLVTWLKNKNIKVKSREKKADLVAKVMEYINAKTKEK